MGSERVYDLSAAQALAAATAATAIPDSFTKKRKNLPGSSVEVALNPEDMGEGSLDPELLKKRYEESLEERAAANQKEDFSDMVAEHAQKMATKKRKTDSGGGGKKGSKDKEFKF